MNDYRSFSFCFSLLYIVILSPLYVLISVVSITSFTKEVLPFPCLFYILFFLLLLCLSNGDAVRTTIFFLNSRLIFILLKISLFFSLSGHETLNTLLQHYTSEISTWNFSAFIMVRKPVPYTTMPYTKCFISVQTQYICGKKISRFLLGLCSHHYSIYCVCMTFPISCDFASCVSEQSQILYRLRLYLLIDLLLFAYIRQVIFVFVWCFSSVSFVFVCISVFLIFSNYRNIVG